MICAARPALNNLGAKQMTIFYSVLFSLGKPQDNPYLPCLSIQLRALLRTGTLRDTDKYYVICDPGTAEVLKGVGSAARAIPLLTQKPDSLYDGMKLKYILPDLLPLNGEEQIVYLDLDMLSYAPLAINGPPDTLLLYPEGPATDSNYCGSDPLDLPAGASGGFFSFRHGPRVAGFFKTLVNRIDESAAQQHYTLDQPLLNHHAAKHKDMIGYLPHDIVSFNGHTNLLKARFFNCCGDPGDGPLHLRKMVDVYLQRFG